MKSNGQKLIVIFAILLLLLLPITLYSCDRPISQSELANECIRIHIRANSNSQEDQQVKLKVRDEITKYLQTRLQNCASKQDAIKTLKYEKKNLVYIANNTLYNNNFQYKASIRLDNEYFPDRNYEGYDFPEGMYDALIISLGSGEGDNWWCVAFPPLCFVPNGNSGEKIEYKSWVKEWLEKTFGR